MKLVTRAEQQMIFKRIIEIWKVVIKYDCIESVDCMRDLYIIGTLLGMQKDIDRVTAWQEGGKHETVRLRTDRGLFDRFKLGRKHAKKNTRKNQWTDTEDF